MDSKTVRTELLEELEFNRGAVHSFLARQKTSSPASAAKITSSQSLGDRKKAKKNSLGENTITATFNATPLTHVQCKVYRVFFLK